MSPLYTLRWWALSLLMTAACQAHVFLRWNQAGYRPDVPKRVVLLSDDDLRGQPWVVVAMATGKVVLSGAVPASVVGGGQHSPKPFNHVLDLSALQALGRYRLTVAKISAELVISSNPYAQLAAEPLLHLRAMRSGAPTLGRAKPSHPGDAHAPVWVPSGDPANGKWVPATPARTVDFSGGWYDAGDQLKFTHTHSYLVYHLLLAYNLQPGLFPKKPGGDLPDILEEARYGLEFLMRTFPDSETFVIQVGDERDHDQELRLPEDDALDGQRPALCALSRVHMAGASAALAMGARTFRASGRDQEAARYAAQAEAIYRRMQGPGTVECAFERGEVNDFYRDAVAADQLCLAAAELYLLTREDRYLEDARRVLPPPAESAGWFDWTLLAHVAFAPMDATARQHLDASTRKIATEALRQGQPWSIPSPYCWAALYNWVSLASASRQADRLVAPDPARRAMFYDLLDYCFGRNNWGVSFLFSERLPNTVRHIYNPMCYMRGRFPTGAFSEGPGDRATHDALSGQHFRQTGVDPLARFDTPLAVFRDDQNDFMCQETTIGGQGELLLLLTLAQMDAPAAPPQP